MSKITEQADRLIKRDEYDRAFALRQDALISFVHIVMGEEDEVRYKQLEEETKILATARRELQC